MFRLMQYIAEQQQTRVHCMTIFKQTTKCWLLWPQRASGNHLAQAIAKGSTVAYGPKVHSWNDILVTHDSWPNLQQPHPLDILEEWDPTSSNPGERLHDSMQRIFKDQWSSRYIQVYQGLKTRCVSTVFQSPTQVMRDAARVATARRSVIGAKVEQGV